MVFSKRFFIVFVIQSITISIDAAQRKQAQSDESITEFIHYVGDNLDGHRFLVKVNELMHGRGTRARAYKLIDSWWTTFTRAKRELKNSIYIRACQLGYWEILQRLLQHRKKLDKYIDTIIDDDGNSLLHWACFENNLAMVHNLINNVYKDEDDNTHTVALICLQNNNGNTALHAAAYYGFSDIVKLLLDNNSITATLNDFIKMQNKKGETALHMASTASCKTLLQLYQAADLQTAMLDTLDDFVSIKNKCGCSAFCCSPFRLLTYFFYKKDLCNCCLSKQDNNYSYSALDGTASDNESYPMDVTETAYNNIDNDPDNDTNLDNRYDYSPPLL